MLFAELTATSRAVAAASSRLRKVELIAECLRRTPKHEVEIAVGYLSGELRQRRTGIGWAAFNDAPPPATASTLEISDVDATFARAAGAAGKGSTTERRRLLHELLGRATTDEQAFIRGLVSGEIRQGALEGVMLDAVARAADVPAIDVRRAVMLAGAIPPVAVAALSEGSAGLEKFRLVVGRPVMPMLAQTATSTGAALAKLGRAAVEWKLDGVRIQVHRNGADVRVFTRTLDDVTDRLPEVVDAALALPVDTAILDGEAIALYDDGRPRPFQATASRAATRVRAAQTVPLTPYVFDVLHLDGTDLIATPAAERYAAWAGVLTEDLRVPRIVTDSTDEAQAFLDNTLARGHEGVVVKSLEVPYDAGRRGAGWLKVKPVHTLDLVVLAAEWGHGRRQGWLSNLHLGARDPATGGFVMLGKTFKGMTDEMLRWQTEKFLTLAVDRNDWVVTLRPELVVEIAFDGVQGSPRYPGGVALRFARVIRYREDKRPEEADTIEAVLAFRPHP
ncbi:MAG: ATP-dependent DNA ligase [Actinomycetes bacterium]